MVLLKLPPHWRASKRDKDKSGMQEDQTVPQCSVSLLCKHLWVKLLKNYSFVQMLLTGHLERFCCRALFCFSIHACMGFLQFPPTGHAH